LEFNVPFQHKYGYIRDEPVISAVLLKLKDFSRLQAVTYTKSVNMLETLQNEDAVITDHY